MQGLMTGGGDSKFVRTKHKTGKVTLDGGTYTITCDFDVKVVALTLNSSNQALFVQTKDYGDANNIYNYNGNDYVGGAIKISGKTVTLTAISSAELSYEYIIIG